MSGGSYDHLYYRIDDAAHKLSQKNQPAYRRAFGALLYKCAKAMHDVEWVDSDDMSAGDDEEAIMQCVQFSDILRCSVHLAEQIRDDLDRVIKEAKKEGKIK
jgi:hypothetical protein